MSRIGTLPITILEGVTVSQADSVVTVKGPKGELTQSIPEGVIVKIADEVEVSITGDEHKNLWGLIRTLIFNMIEGVTNGFEKKLQVLGVGYSAKAQGQKLTLNLGLSHPVYHEAPAGISVTVDKDPQGNDMVILQGIDKQLIGEQAAKIKAYRKPEPYKGKGIRYFGEYIKIKPGKTAGK